MKTILITGSTDGIGKLAALKLATDGHRIIMHGRNPTKLAACISELKTATGNAHINGYVADFANMDSLRQMLSALISEIPQLDVIINNAGVFKSAETRTADGYDVRFAVNYFAPFLLTQGLLPLLEKSDQPRIINLSSAAQSPVVLEALRGTVELSAQQAYAQSKLALTMWSVYMAKNHPDLLVIAVNPGSLLNTKMVKEAYGNHWSPADKGGSILYELATSEAYLNTSGKYFDNDKGDPKGYFAPAHGDAENDLKINQLIAFTEDLMQA